MATTIRIDTDVTDESVKRHSGKDWQHWKKILDKAGAQEWPRKQIVAYLNTKYKLTPWWQQMVTTGYEILIGKKIQGRNSKGEFAVTATKTLKIAAKELWKILESEEGLAIWLKPLSKFKLKAGAHFESEGGIFGEIRTMKAGLRIRIKWQNENWDKSTVVQVFLVPKGPKTILVFYHEKLVNGRLRTEIRDHWKQVHKDLEDFIQRI